MHVKKLDENCYYYTDLLSDIDKEKVSSAIREQSNWLRVYNDGKEYDPNRDPDLFENQTLMLTFRKHFPEPEYTEIINIINAAYQKAVDHYIESHKITAENELPRFTDVDKHLQGTVYMTHIDTAPIEVQSYTMLMYLNDDYGGGEISFSMPTADGKIKVVNGILEKGPKGLYRPDHDKNKDLITFWIKPEAFSILIFPPLKPYPHTVHEITEGEKYLIKGHWQVNMSDHISFSSNPYEGLSEDEIEALDANGAARHAEIDKIRKNSSDLVPDEYKEFYI